MMVTLNSANGGSFQAYYQAATNTQPNHLSPSIVLIQEIFGVNASMRAAADLWASLGFNVLCPDLFWRSQPGVELEPKIEAEFKKGVELMQALNLDEATADLDVARQWLINKTQNPKVACLGYCLGGRLAVKMAADTDITCAVSYYGVGLENMLPNMPKLAPTILHIAELDSYVPPPVRAAILEQVSAKAGLQAHIYDQCDHGFARINGAHWDAQAVALAQQRSLDFMKHHLS